MAGPINVIALRPELNKADRSFRIKSGQEKNHVSTEEAAHRSEIK